MPQYIYFLDLVDDPVVFAEYDSWHANVWPEVLEHLRASGFTACQIFRASNRLVMLASSATQVPSDGGGLPVPAKVTEWETMMDRYQVPLPTASPGQKWTLADQVFDWRA